MLCYMKKRKRVIDKIQRRGNSVYDKKGYPATLAFVADVAWEIVLKLWTIAEGVCDHEEVVLEPSFAAYALEKPSTEKTKNENGNKKSSGEISDNRTATTRAPTMRFHFGFQSMTST